MVGTALLAAADGAGYTRAAAACAAPISTVRDWIRAVRRGVPALIGHAARLLQATGDPAEMWPTPSRPVPALTAAHGFACWLTRPAPTAAGPVTGVDYLGLLLRQHGQDLVRRLHLADPFTSSAARHATPWQMITVITAGRLLTGVPG